MNTGLILYRFQNEANEAVPLLRQSMEILRACHGRDHVDSVMGAIHLGVALIPCNPAEAGTLLSEALNTAEVHGNETCLGPALAAQGALDLTNGDVEMATHRLERALPLCLQIHGTGVFYTEQCRYHLGLACIKQDRREQARELLETCRPYFELKLTPADERWVQLNQSLEGVRSDHVSA
jgi:hypothetical protein